MTSLVFPLENDQTPSLDSLIDALEVYSNSYSLTDEYLESAHVDTRPKVGIGEYRYGIVMVPEDWVLPYLRELQERRKADEKET